MKLTFRREFKGDLSVLPIREVEGAVPFKEPESMGKLSLIANGIALVLIILVLIPIFLLHGRDLFSAHFPQVLLAMILSLAIIPAHELLHAICFRENVDFYTYFRKGLCFVVGTESMTKKHFVFMSLLPNLVFGVLPYALFFVFPSQIWLGVFGAFNIGAGGGDYINAFNALTQMPKGSLCFMSGMHSYWYRPE